MESYVDLILFVPKHFTEKKKAGKMYVLYSLYTIYEYMMQSAIMYHFFAFKACFVDWIY